MYSPGISYIGPQLWASALSRFGGDIGDALNKTEEIRKQNALNDPIMQHALEQGRITQEEFNKYQQANFTTKAAMANGIMANVNDEWKRAQFAAEEQDKAMQRALSLQIAQMAHDPGPMAYQPIYGQAPEPDEAYAERGLDLTPTGEAPPVDRGPQLGVWGERGAAHMFPARDVTGAGMGDIAVDKTSLPGYSVVHKGGSNQFQVVPNSPGDVGTVLTGPDVPPNTVMVGPRGTIKPIPKDVRRQMNAAAMPTPSPTPTPAARQVGDFLYNQTIGRVTGAQTPIPTVVAPPPPQKVFVVSPDGKQSGWIRPERLQDYLNANWTQGAPPQ
jgi:hypothetical protein